MQVLPRVFRLGRRTATALGVLGAALALTATSVGVANGAPRPDPKPLHVKPGQAYMGVGARIHEGVPAEKPARGLLAPTDGVQGIDVSHWQGGIDWTSVRDAGIQFAWMKATEGTTYKDDRFNTNYPAAHAAGVIRGAYHFALPDASSGAAQATYFAANGGGWSRDHLTLPGVLDIEHNPYGAMCYGLSTTQMRTWINDFHTAYKARTTRDVVIYTTASWWNTCTGNWTGMSAKSPLWVAHWTSASSPAVPSGFPTWTVWQYTSTGSVPGVSGNVDRDQFNGSRDRLLALADNT
ncbi:lysozyme [Streptomyces sp. YIM B13518]|uniref:lysozyme n=1 Tax=Streptomyces sp. YIM B13518 TaxID=3366316 RepID=UPI0036A4D1D0